MISRLCLWYCIGCSRWSGCPCCCRRLSVAPANPRAPALGSAGEQEKLGEVRDFPSIRKMFMQIPAEFCSKVICAGVSSRDPSTLDFSASAAGTGTGKGVAGAGSGKGPLTGEAMLTEASRLLSASVKPGEGSVDYGRGGVGIKRPVPWVGDEGVFGPGGGQIDAYHTFKLRRGEGL